MTMLADPESDVTGEAFAAAVGAARELVAGLADRVGWLAPGSRHAVGAALAGLRDDVARVELEVVGQFEKLRAFGMDGARSTESWLEQRAGHSAVSAKQLTAALAASKVDAVRSALASGGLSVAQASVLTPLATRVAEGRCAPSELEGLLAGAKASTVGGIRHEVAKVITRLDAEEGADASSHRALTSHDTRHGTKVWRLELEPAAHATFGNAIQALVDETRRKGHNPTTAELSRLRADAAVELARRFLHGTSTGSATAVRSKATPELIAVIDHRVLMGELEGIGRLADGAPIAGETARRIACDAGILPAVLGGAGEVLDLGRARRLASSPQRKALLSAWTTCGFPGCNIPVHWTKAHHTNPWQPGGTTDLALLVPLCERHHHFVHEGRWSITRDGTRYTFHRPDGTAHATVEPNGGDP